MNPDGIFALIALFGMAGFSLTGLKMFLNYRAKRLELSGGSADTRRLEELVGELRDEVRLEARYLRAEITDLQERMDFAERLLTRGQSGGEE
jgi:hypothetical protein